LACVCGYESNYKQIDRMVEFAIEKGFQNIIPETVSELSGKR
jgi:hypothetical protein